MKQKHLFYIAALIWGIPGVFISIKGIKAYCAQPSSDLWWLILISLAVISAFLTIFRRIVAKYSARIISLKGNITPCDTFSKSGWAIILFMMGLGMALKLIPGIPSAFTASFYSGLGPALIYAAITFTTNTKRL